ncbi:AlpA family phage regulatory protein [Microbulbifer sp. CnH-101-G]
MHRLKRSSIYRIIKEKGFPHQRQIDPGAVSWDSQEVEAWKR